MRRPPLVIAAVILLLPMSSRVHAQVFPADDRWVPVLRAGVPVFDPALDSAAGAGAGDLTSATQPAAFVFVDSSYLYLRVRVDSDPRPGGTLATFGWAVEFDTDLNGTNYETFCQLNGKLSRVELWRNTVRTGGYGDAAEILASTYAASTNARTSADGGTDYFVDWAVPLSDLAASGFGTQVRLAFGATSNASPALTTGLSGDVAGITSCTCTLADVLSDTLNVTCGTFSTCTTGVPEAQRGGPALHLDVAPHPVRSDCRFDLRLPTDGHVGLRVLGIDGRVVRRLHEGFLSAGPHSFTWDARDQQGRQVRSGVYVAELHEGSSSLRRTVIVTR